ncbi:MAG: HAMP domain-containing histidine kinase, partial [Planctomycetes bacterium]|nr:HAMP domain-containing histidine kinase [Planctomycetota bacterium]
MTNANMSAANVVKAAFGAGDYPRAAALVTMLRLHWFTRLRWVFLVVAIVVLTVERLALPDVQRPLLSLMVVLAVLGIVNLGWVALSHLLFRRFREEASGEPQRYVELLANAQVAVDLLLLTCILRFTGGVENPMAIFYLFHMAITALLLQRWQAILNGIWALMLYTAMVVGEWRHWLTPHYEFLPQCPVELHTMPEFVFSSLAVVACGILGTLYFTLQIAGRLRRREQALSNANQALHESQSAIQNLQERRSRFMQTAAHQLKSPLAAIQTLTELIRGEIVPPEAVRGTCDKIVQRCREGVGQVAELLALARVQDGDPRRHQRCEADVRAVISSLCERFGVVATEKQVELTCHMPETGELRIRVDPQDLSDCAGNLIDNAIKYTPGPGRVTVTVSTDSPAVGPEGVTITVTDTGIGISPDILTSKDGTPAHAPVFDAFRRGTNALTAGIPGTGLGLSIVREIV